MNFRKIAALCLVTMLLAVLPIWAANTVITTQSPKGPYPGTVSAGQLDLTWTAADTVNGNAFVMTGHEILLMWNPDASAHTVTISSVSDVRNRTGDVTNYSIAATTISAFNFVGLTDGWQQSNGQVYFSSNSNLIKFAIITEPR